MLSFFGARIGGNLVRSAMRCGAYVALAAGLALANSANADSCGHYVKRLGPGFVPGKAAADKIAAQSHSMPAKTPCPCEGPQCGRGPQDQTPLPPGAPPRTVSPQELMPLAGDDVEITFGSSWLRGEFSGRTSRGYPLGTNRPPSA